MEHFDEDGLDGNDTFEPAGEPAGELEVDPGSEESSELRSRTFRDVAYLHVLVSRSINMLSVTDFVPKESFPGSEFKPASIWTCWMLIDRQMQSAFIPELHRWISKLIARHLQLVHQEIF